MAIRIIMLMSLYWFFTLFLPFKFFIGKIGIQGDSIERRLTDKEKRFLIFLFRIFKGMGKYKLLKFRCLIRVLAAAKLLRMKKIPYTVFLGVQKKNKRLKAHAWIISEEIMVTGDTKGEFNTVSFFSYY